MASVNKLDNQQLPHPQKKGKSFRDKKQNAKILSLRFAQLMLPALLVIGFGNWASLGCLAYMIAVAIITGVLGMISLSHWDSRNFLRTLDFASGRKVDGTFVFYLVLDYFWVIASVNNVVVILLCKFVFKDSE